MFRKCLHVVERQDRPVRHAPKDANVGGRRDGLLSLIFVAHPGLLVLYRDLEASSRNTEVELENVVVAAVTEAAAAAAVGDMDLAWELGLGYDVGDQGLDAVVAVAVVFVVVVAAVVEHVREVQRE